MLPPIDSAAAASPATAIATHSAYAAAVAVTCLPLSRNVSQAGTRDVAASTSDPSTSQYGQASDALGASRTRSGSNARRRRRGPELVARNTRIAASATTKTASPSVMPNRARESTPIASAPAALTPRAIATPSSTAALGRIRLHASPISRMSSVRIALAMLEAASSPAARAGAAAKTHARPATANVNPWYWKPWMVMAAPTAVTPAPARIRALRGSIETSE